MAKQTNNLAALTRSLKSEDEHLEARFAKADGILKVRDQPREVAVRENFSIAPDDSKLLCELQSRSFGYGLPANKSEIVRTALQALAHADEDTFRAARAKVAKLRGKEAKAKAS